MRSGVILAGGRSTRFGERDKALAPLAGRPMIRRVADRVAPAVDRLVVNCRRAQRDAIEAAMAGVASPVTFAIDPVPNRGPLAGVRTGLRGIDGGYAFVSACDMPLIDPVLVGHLFDRADGHDGAIPRLGDGRLQPAHAVYRTARMASACDHALDRGDRSLHAPLGRLDLVVVDRQEIESVSSARSFVNVNTPGEFDRLMAEFRPRPDRSNGRIRDDPVER